MAFNVTDFQSRVRDVVRTHQFQCNIVFPSAIPGGTSEIVNILAESANLPGKKIAEVMLNYAGAPLKLAGKVSYTPWTVVFRVDDNLDVYKKFRAWSELCLGTESNIAAFPAQYKSNPIMYQLDNNGNKIAQLTLNGAWPSDIADLAYDTKDKTVVTLDVTFAYDFPVYKVL